MKHPDAEELRRVAVGTASREEARGVVAHLLKGCLSCAATVKSLADPTGIPGGAKRIEISRASLSSLLHA